MVVLSVIFQKYSIELAVDEWATDDEVAQMSIKDKKALYKKAKDKAKQTIRGASSRLTLKLHTSEGGEEGRREIREFCGLAYKDRD